MYELIEIGGKSRRLRYEINDICDIEEKADRGIAALFSAERIGFNTARLLLWGGLKWQDRGLTLQRAGNFIKDYMEDGGGYEELMQILQNALEKAGVLEFAAADEEEGNAEAGTA